MYKLLPMIVLQTTHNLSGKQQTSFKSELRVTVLMQVLKAGAEELSDHDIEVTFLASPVEGGDALLTLEDSEDFCLVQDLWEFNAHVL